MRGEARDDSVRRHHIENIQSFDGGRNQRRVTIVLGLPASGNVRVRRVERNYFAESEIFSARRAMPAACRQGHCCLNFDYLLNWPVDSTAECVTVGVIMVGSRALSHWL